MELLDGENNYVRCQKSPIVKLGRNHWMWSVQDNVCALNNSFKFPSRFLFVAWPSASTSSSSSSSSEVNENLSQPLDPLSPTPSSGQPVEWPDLGVFFANIYLEDFRWIWSLFRRCPRRPRRPLQRRLRRPPLHPLPTSMREWSWSSRSNWVISCRWTESYTIKCGRRNIKVRKCMGNFPGKEIRLKYDHVWMM